MAPRKKNEAAKSFEAELAELEGLVASMEKGEVPLAELVSRYARASSLLANCRRALDEAELTIERLKSGAAGMQTEPFPAGKDAAGDLDD
ncbi:MAG TPA: exodeoxyribonuclease VII small subunit [Opitutales bacterium]|nr:exodeoxyribonuclease VII small subunit [Opitutales bacterium]